MSTLEELEQRLAAVERRLNLQAGLRASQDSDLSDMAQSLRAQAALIQALAITQSQHTTQLDRIVDRLGQVDGKLDGLTGASQTIINLLTGLTEHEG